MLTFKSMTRIIEGIKSTSIISNNKINPGLKDLLKFLLVKVKSKSVKRKRGATYLNNEVILNFMNALCIRVYEEPYVSTVLFSADNK